jgi:hypothetical protein
MVQVILDKPVILPNKHIFIPKTYTLLSDVTIESHYKNWIRPPIDVSGWKINTMTWEREWVTLDLSYVEGGRYY